MFRRTLLSVVCLLAWWGTGPAVNFAVACPMCKAANDSESLRPKAYMYSILFMLAMPATILTGFGVTFWRLSKQPLEKEPRTE